MSAHPDSRCTPLPPLPPPLPLPLLPRHGILLAAVLFPTLAFLPLSTLAGCSSSYGGKRTLIAPQNPDEPLTATATGDWNDVEASVEVSLMKTELALLSATPSVLPGGLKCMKFDLLATDDSIVTLWARQPVVGAGEMESGQIELEVFTRPRRDLQREMRLMEAVTKRLNTLAGVEWAPMR